MEVDAKGILYKLTELFGLKRDSIKDRIKLQKTIYLLQAYGLHSGYGFSWYKYGPYSQDLSYDAYAVLGPERSVYKEKTASWKFCQNSLRRFEQFKKVCGDVLNNPQKLELVASVDFVRQTWQPEMTRTNAVGIFKQCKTQFFDGSQIEDKEIEDAFDLCNTIRANQPVRT
jgi:hypothetical protein